MASSKCQQTFLFVLLFCLVIVSFFDEKIHGTEAIVVLSAYRMRNQRRPTNHWNQDYRFNRPRALYQSLAKRSAMKRERILDSLGGDYLIRKRDF